MAKQPANPGAGKIEVIADKFPRFTRKQALWIVIVGVVVCGVAYVVTHPQPPTQATEPVTVVAESGGPAQVQPGDVQQQQDGVQQSSGGNSMSVGDVTGSSNQFAQGDITNNPLPK